MDHGRKPFVQSTCLIEQPPVFQAFFQAGFECSTHRNLAGKRIDVISATRHDLFARQDFEILKSLGITTGREGARWHLIESIPDSYDFSSLTPILDAANASGMEIILDLFHFGWPDHLDIFGTEFVAAFARYTRKLVRFLRERGQTRLFFAPVNEISFLSWAGGDLGFVNPFAVRRGDELKRRLVQAYVVASEIILDELPEARLVSPDPVIHIAGNPADETAWGEAEMYRLAQFEAWDMISGRMAPELGGCPEFLDIIGINFYDRNQWVHNSNILTRGDPLYRPFREILNEVWQRYRRPVFVAETGSEDEMRAEWFNYICAEVSAAITAGVPVTGICLYPILNHPGWDDDRHCYNGLLDYADESGHRDIYLPLASAIQEQRPNFSGMDRQTNHAYFSN